MFENLELFQTSHKMARHAGQRQALVARNMANSDTPKYQPEDLVDFKSHQNSTSGMKATRETHLNAISTAHSFDTVQVNGNTPSPNGNGVSIEEEMLRAVDVQRQHSRALSVYRHSLNILRASLGRQ